MKYIVKICGSKLEKCDFRNILLSNNKMKKSANNFNETDFQKKLIDSFDKKLNDKLMELEKKIIKEKSDFENKLVERFKLENKKNVDEIKSLKNELNKKIKEEIMTEQSQKYKLNTKKNGNLRKNYEALNKFKQTDIEIEGDFENKMNYIDVIPENIPKIPYKLSKKY